MCINRWTHSFFRLDGIVGTNFNFCVPCLVTSTCFFAKLPIALLGEDGRDSDRLGPASPEPEALGFEEDATAPCCDLVPEA
jgi:hypothetical protein